MNFWTDIHPAVVMAEDMLFAVDGNMSLLPHSVQIFLLVNGAQGVIDNGGYIFFFENDWPGTPPYEDFITAYETIGCIEEAADLRRVVATFQFSDPHLHKDKRREYMDVRYDKRVYGIPEWGSFLCGNKNIWENLARYYQTNQEDFI